MIGKSLYDISWKVTEEEYRADPALSYSTLARYEREGFNNLDKLFDKVESPSLTFGSAVDTLITGSEEEFNNQFMVAELSNILSDTLVSIVKRLFDTFKETWGSLKEIPDEQILETISDIQWNNHWLPKTRVNKIKEECAGYYNLLYLANGKTIISSAVYSDVLNTVDKLRSADSTKFFFEPNNAFDNTIERYYQLKFKSTFNRIDYRCMADLIIVNHNRKIIIPVDLKTSSKYEWDFYKSFLDWNYYTQARLYWRIIRDNLDKDPYFKEFTLVDYKFIVINKKTLIPLVWSFDSTQSTGDLYLGKNKQIVIRDPFTIGEELNKYLSDKPLVPNGINTDRPNTLEEWINKME